MAENKDVAPVGETVDPIEDAGTNQFGIDLNDWRLKGATDNPDLQARNEAEMQAQTGVDKPVVEQLRDAQDSLVSMPVDGEAPADKGADKGAADKKTQK